MVEFRYLFVLSILFFWLAGSGCVGNDASDMEEGITTDIPGTEENTSAKQSLTEAEIQEFEGNILELEDLLSNSSLDEEIVIEEL
ncbi:hypothetical protein MSHOH_2573 [Methanosarcina horonobensis HB-1 = JCM 15518]|uniref:Uncharacterized protein n=1 Tax=Methanosarcina horonobensis HB-1 = JCM 15518 TaxID=1434110 RepID=A0A0E3SDV5_9EURY|nr:hypothetical protein [Methanosarcina horonobensis]AKB79056.1 hypothetical protein MSHOH_2573 [Methanosarcina horonobensis HB-1 = JCM 15518]